VLAQFLYYCESYQILQGSLLGTSAPREYVTPLITHSVTVSVHVCKTKTVT